MKFYIWKNDKGTVGKNISCTENFDEALRSFEYYRNKKKIYKEDTEIRLIVDFETRSKMNPFKKYTMFEYGYDRLNYFVLADTESMDKTNGYVHDVTYITKNGFRNYFTDNVKAMKRFISMVERGDNVIWNINIHSKNNNKFNYLRIISTSNDIYDIKKSLPGFKIPKDHVPFQYTTYIDDTIKFEELAMVE
jgi:hypothetical protein